MKLSEFQKPAPPVSAPVGQVASPVEPSEAPQEEQQYGVTEKTPSGIEVYYQPQRDDPPQRRLYRVNSIEVPGNTTVLDVLDSSGPLIWWGQKVGVAGALTWMGHGDAPELIAPYSGLGPDDPAVLSLVDWMTAQQITTNHQRDKAADRGTNVHKALERWCETGVMPEPDDFPDHERGYVVALVAYLTDTQGAVDFDSIQSEVMVGSAEHLFAGRYDLRMTLTKPCEMVVRIYPKAKPKVMEIPAGRYLKDAKTSSGVYDKHFLQLEGYEGASLECGYDPTDYRAVLHLADDGRYELVLNGAQTHPEAKKQWTFEDFLAVRACYAVMHERKRLANEREVLQAFTEELDAKEVA